MASASLAGTLKLHDISAYELSENLRIVTEDPTHIQCIQYLIQHIPLELVVYSNGKMCNITPEFRQLLNTHWSPNSRRIILWFYVAGFVPVQILLCDDQPIPYVLEFGTHTFKTYYNPQTGKTMIIPYRNVDFFGDKSVDRQQVQSKSDAELNYIHAHSTSMRVDILNDVAHGIGPTVDETVYVLHGFGFDPSPTGKLRSIVSALREITDIKRALLNLYIQSSNRVLEAQPFAVPANPSEAEIESFDRGISGASSAADDGARRFFTRSNDQQQMASMYQNKEDEQYAAQGYGTVKHTNPSDRAQQPFPVGAHNISHPNHCRYLTNGVSVYQNAPSQPNWGQLNFLIENIHRTIVNTYGLIDSLFEQRASQQGNVQIQEQKLQNTTTRLNNILTKINTSMYDAIYGADDRRGGLSEVVDHWLGPKMIERIEIALLAWYEATRDALLNGGVDPNNATTQMINYDYTHSDLPMRLRESGNFLLTLVAQNPKFIKKYKGTMDRFARTVLGSKKMVSESKRDTMSDRDFERLAAMAQSDNPHERTLYNIAMFIQSLRSMKATSLMDIFEDMPHGEDKQWYYEKTTKIGRKFKVYSSRQNVIITYPARSHLSNDTIKGMYLDGFASMHEANEMIRVNADLYVSNDVLSESKNTPIANCRDLLARSNIKKLIAETSMEPMVGMAEAALKARESEAVAIALAQYKLKTQLATEGSSNPKKPTKNKAKPKTKKTPTSSQSESESESDSDDTKTRAKSNEESAARRTRSTTAKTTESDSAAAKKSAANVKKRKLDQSTTGAKKQKKSV